jgi:hypothetical protein
MKKLTLLFSGIILLSCATWAQSNNEEIDLVQAAFGMEKKAIVAEFVQVDTAQKAAFWTLYDEYETARKALGKERIELATKYNENYETMTAAEADAFMKQVIDLSKRTDDLIVTYYTKISKDVSPITAMQFYTIEQYILTAIRNKILSELPVLQLKK